jgi:hypothetical protein
LISHLLYGSCTRFEDYIALNENHGVVKEVGDFHRGIEEIHEISIFIFDFTGEL